MIVSSSKNSRYIISFLLKEYIFVFFILYFLVCLSIVFFGILVVLFWVLYVIFVFKEDNCVVVLWFLIWWKLVLLWLLRKYVVRIMRRIILIGWRMNRFLVKEINIEDNYWFVMFFFYIKLKKKVKYVDIDIVVRFRN